MYKELVHLIFSDTPKHVIKIWNDYIGIEDFGHFSQPYYYAAELWLLVYCLYVQEIFEKAWLNHKINLGNLAYIGEEI